MQNLDEPLINELESKRSIGTYQGSKGPTLIILGGLHGNEPAGIIAFKRVIEAIKKSNVRFNGRLCGFKGNISALSKNERFLDEDMNRRWNTFMKNKTSGEIILKAEDKERRELLKSITDIISESQGPFVFIDLHSTSAPSLPFVSINDSLYNRNLVKDLPVPIILGLQEQIEGTLNGFLNELGIPAVLFEAGQHKEPETIDFHEAFLWYMLDKLGCIPKDYQIGIINSKEILRNASKGKHGFYEVKFRYPISDDQKFKMVKGFESFKPVKKETIVATDMYGNVKTPFSDLIFMPLYQKKGEDGYFLIRRIKPFWLKFSEWIRKRRLDRFVHLLPGVKELNHEKGTFLIDQSIAFIFALQTFHLLGYRKEKTIDNRLYVSRIRYNNIPPSKEEFFKNLEEFVRQD